jgi:hypothetical protein
MPASYSILGQWEGISLRSTADTRSLAVLLAVIAAVLLVAWVVSWYSRRQEHRRRHSASALFNELCRVHKLTWSDRQLLSQLARLAGLDIKARLFLDADAWSRTLPQVTDPNLHQRCVALQEKLFGQGKNHPTE